MRTCKRCLKNYDAYPALSRRDNKTEICPDCGVEEAMVDFAKANGAEIPYKVAERELKFAYRLKGLTSA